MADISDVTYRQCDCEGDCYVRDWDNEGAEGKCWGQVDVFEETDHNGDFIRIHACEGHWALLKYGEYVPPTDGG